MGGVGGAICGGSRGVVGVVYVVVRVVGGMAVWVVGSAVRGALGAVGAVSSVHVGGPWLGVGCSCVGLVTVCAGGVVPVLHSARSFCFVLFAGCGCVVLGAHVVPMLVCVIRGVGAHMSVGVGTCVLFLWCVTGWASVSTCPCLCRVGQRVALLVLAGAMLVVWVCLLRICVVVIMS